MKTLAPRITFLIILLGCISQSFSQVGIGTTHPQAMLDVDGTIRVTGMKASYQEVEAVRIIGVDDDGNFVEVQVDENLVLENNMIRAANRKVYYGAVADITITTINNLNLLILPGEPNDDKTLIPIKTTVGNIAITGIAAAEDGRRITLYAYSGAVRIWDYNASSDPENQIANNNFINLNRYDMVELMYDASIQKWVVMD